MSFDVSIAAAGGGADVAAGAAARPKPLWQPWSDSDDDSNQVRRELIGYEDEEEEEEEEREDGGWNSTASKQLPTRAKKERRRHERHCDLISTASRNSRTHRKQAEAAAAAAAAAGSGGSAREDAVDHPLDMSTSSRRNVSGAPPPPYPHNLTDRDRDRIGIGAAGAYPMYPSPPDYTARPSVITCASSLRSSPAPSCPSPCSSTGSVSSSSAALRAASPVHHHQQQQQQRGRSDPADRIPQRREIISSGMSDPVIDEHFRRSLGERYTHLFASTSPAPTSSMTAADSSCSNPSRDDKLPSTVNVTGLSVDDHFAKALGETWLKLQNESKDKEINGSISDSQPGSPMTTQRHGLVLT